jgi:MFS family permease
VLLSLFGVSYGLIQGPSVGFTNPLIIGSIIVGVICALAFIPVENKAKEPIMPLSLFKNKLVFGANLATLFLYFALSGLIFFFILNLQQVQHYSPLWAGISLLPTILIITFLSAPAGSLGDRIGPRKPMIIGPILVGIGMTILALTGTNANYFTSYLPGLVLFGLGMALVIAPLTKSALSVDERYSGVASGVNNAVARIAGLLAVSLLGAIMVGKFSSDLVYGMTNTHIPVSQQKMIASQAQKLGAITIPYSFTSPDKKETAAVMDHSFIDSFRWITGINAFLAFLSAGVSYFFINPKKKLPIA